MMTVSPAQYDPSGMFEKIPVRALSDTVAQQLLKQIEKGAFAKTGKLPTEAVLAQEFGVSRTVIREAVSRLKNEGVVEPRQGSGVFIVERAGIRPLRIDYAEAVEPAAVLQILALRRAIEAEVASEAALRRTDAEMKAIDAALAKIDAAVADGEDGVAEDVAFHRAIAVVTGNPSISTWKPVPSSLAATRRFVRIFRGRFATSMRLSRLPFARAIRWPHAMPHKPICTTRRAGSLKRGYAEPSVGAG